MRDIRRNDERADYVRVSRHANYLFPSGIASQKTVQGGA